MSLIVLLLTPLFGLIIICSKMQNYNINNFNKYKYAQDLKTMALKVSIVSLLISLYLFIFYNFSNNYFQFVQDHIDENYFNLSFGIDGSSIYFVLLTTIIIPISLLSNWKSITEKIKPFLIIILLLETLLLSIFLVLDGLLFYVFFESILPPLFILIGMFGSADKVRASFYLFLYTLLGSLFMLLSILKICSLVGYIQYDAVYKSNIIYYFQIFLFAGIFIAFAVKTPTIFLNNWLLKAHVESPLSGSIILAGIVLKLSLYGIFRLMLPLLAKACIVMTKLVYVIGFITVIYGSASTIRTIDVKELIAYSSVCHAAVYLMGVFSNVVTGIEGGILLGLAHGFVSSGLFICVGGVLYDRSSTRLVTIYRGMTQVMPIFSILLFILCLGNCGVPLTLNFLGEFMSLYGIFERHTLFAPLASLSIILSAAYTIYLFNRIAFAGSYSKHFNVNVSDVNKREFYILLTLVIFTVVLGVYPAPILDGLHYNVSMLIYNLIIVPITINFKSGKIINNVFSIQRCKNGIFYISSSSHKHSNLTTIIPKNKGSKILNVKSKTIDKNRKNVIKNDKGYNFTQKIKQFPAANKEWHNSLYHYNKNNIMKCIPTLDNTIYTLIKSYFNVYSKKLEKRFIFYSRRRRIAKKRRSINKVLISRPELKHTNDKIVINAYTFDAQKKYFLNKIKKISSKWIMKRKKIYALKKVSAITRKLKLNLNSKLLNQVNFLRKLTKINNIKYYKLKHINDKFKFETYKKFVSIALVKEISSVYFKQLITLKKMKFEKKYLFYLAKEIKKLYNKDVDFNFVNIKYLYLNSDLMSTAMVLKIRNLFRKKKNIFKAVSKSLRMMKIPKDVTNNTYEEIYKRKKFIQTLTIDNFFNNLSSQNTKNSAVDYKKNFLLKLRNSWQDISNSLSEEKIYTEKDILEASSLEVLPKVTNNITKVIKSIKYKFLNGAKIEIAGRLNKRKKATRSTNKIKYKGNVRNIHSSDKGLSAVLLRGYFKSNLQSSNINSKLQGGSFGTKIFISGK